MIEIIKHRLGSYPPNERDHALKQIHQEIALYGLWRANFFEHALFQGGTSLRILYGLPRFSEDLDFLLRAAHPEFKWTPYLDKLVDVFREFGLALQAQPKGQMDNSIRQALLKSDSIASQLNLHLAPKGQAKTVKIKLEIDINPPAHSGQATTFLDFPADHEVRHQDLASNFALKIHALLCRPYVKGRDWFDFSWYVAKGTTPNLKHLQAALLQAGPFKDQQNLVVTPSWLKSALKETINNIDWKAAADDVRPFLRPVEANTLTLWSKAFFLAKLGKLQFGS